MSSKQTQQQQLQETTKNNLAARPVTKSIGTLLQSKRKKVKFDPYYQRNYVWDTVKATYFIESILLGVEIPPLIMFISKIDRNNYEVIDGRQRFETLKRFFESKFSLSKKGLTKLTKLGGASYKSLDPEFQRVFLDTTLRLIEFSTIQEENANVQKEVEDLIKKEVFWRYNSGITPLKTLEVERANHLDDEFTKLMDSLFKTEPEWLDSFKKIFFAQKKIEITNTECQARIRELLVLIYFPINTYVSSTGRKETIEMLYEQFIEQSENQDEIVQSFINKIYFLLPIFEQLNDNEWLIYQGIYWGLSVIESNGVELQDYLVKDVQNKLILLINDNLELFSGGEKSFSKVAKARFNLLANFFLTSLEEQNLPTVNFSIYLQNSLDRKSKPDSDTDKITNTQMRLVRPDAVTKTIEDLIREMNQTPFLVRPAYQRQEVKNIKKSSGIIESMLLGIPLPTIFIYRRDDDVGTCEVIDGQQRLLSVLAFMGEAYRDELNREVKSTKDHYKLSSKMTILTKFRNYSFSQLPEEWADRLWDFELSVVYIDEKQNSDFDPIDLFIRLNNKPYPVKDHTFEMWNSYSDRTIVEEIKSIVKQSHKWFAYRVDNKRMANEELFTIFAYLGYEFEENNIDIFDHVDIYQSLPQTLTFRIQKSLVTEWLHEGYGQENLIFHQKIMSSIEHSKSFIEKVQVVSSSIQYHGDFKDKSGNELLKVQLDKLMNLDKAIYRGQKQFYVLWFLLLKLDLTLINNNAAELAKGIIEFFKGSMTMPDDFKETGLKPKEFFASKVEAFWDRYSN